MLRPMIPISSALLMCLFCLRNDVHVEAFSIDNRQVPQHKMTLMGSTQPTSGLTDWVIAGLESKCFFLQLSFDV
jgi:hypothetical protein